MVDGGYWLNEIKIARRGTVWLGRRICSGASIATAAMPGLGRAIPCSALAQQRHKIIRNRLALVSEESVSGLTRGSGRGITQENPPMRIYIIGNDGIMLC